MFGRGGRGSASKSNSVHKQPAKATRKSPQSGRLRAGVDTAQIISRLRRSGEYRSPPKRSGHEVAASWGFSGGWVGGQSEYKKACEADTTPNERLGTHPIARKRSASASRKSLRCGRLRVGADTAQKSHGFAEAVDTALPRREAAKRGENGVGACFRRITRPRSERNALRLRGGFRSVGWVGRASIKKPAKQTPHQTSDWAHTQPPALGRVWVACFACV